MSTDAEYFIPDSIEGTTQHRYRIIKRIGKGTFSTVFLCESLA
jgi:serine/threonine protein kinase